MKLSTDNQTLLVTFQNGSHNKRIICQGKGFLETLKEEEEQTAKGIESIKIFDTKNSKFKKVSKSFIKSLFSWETETIIYLNNHYFFKNV